MNRVRGAAETNIARETLRQILAVRYVVDTMARGPVRMPATLGTDANLYADRELERHTSLSSKKK